MFDPETPNVNSFPQPNVRTEFSKWLASKSFDVLNNMNKILSTIIIILVGICATGCEGNGTRSSADLADQIINYADTVCLERGETANIEILEGTSDDVIITCKDGSNHFHDG